MIAFALIYLLLSIINGYLFIQSGHIFDLIAQIGFLLLSFKFIGKKKCH